MTYEAVYRACLLGGLVSGFAIGTYYRTRADRSGGQVSIRGEPVGLAIFLRVMALVAVICIFTFVFAPRKMDWSAVTMPHWLRLIGIPMGIAGLAGFWWMFAHLGHNVTQTVVPREQAVLVTTGPYAWVRHPMYAFGWVLLPAVFLLTANWFYLVAAVLAMGTLVWRTNIEERNLIERFGDDYRRYMQRTGRFFPKFKLRSDDGQ
jgi:protein-S-isoprenylcysteine O-methyltransferase Ste14